MTRSWPEDRMDSFVRFSSELSVLADCPKITDRSFVLRFVANLPARSKIVHNQLRSEYIGYSKFLMVCRYKILGDLYSFMSEALPLEYCQVPFMGPPMIIAHIPALKAFDYMYRTLGVPVEEWFKFVVNDVKLVEPKPNGNNADAYVRDDRVCGP